VLVESNTTGTGRLFAERACDLGLVPHLLSVDATRYGYPAELGLPSHGCDTGSPAAVLEACRRLVGAQRVVGVTTSSEYFVDVAARVARSLGLPGEDPDVLTAARSKSVQRERFAAHGVDSPVHRTVMSAADAVAAALAIGLPVVVKPISGSGSLGVRRCDTREEVAGQARLLLGATADERARPAPTGVLVESYLAGPEYSVEVLAGKVRAVVAKHLDESLGFLEVGHDVPAPVDTETDAALRRSARFALAALGLTRGAAHVELRVMHGRAYVIEVNPRLAGGMIPVAVQAATGQDLIAELVAWTAGRQRPSVPDTNRCASIRFLVPDRDGTVRAVPDPTAVRALDGVIDAAVTARPGQQVVRQGAYLDRLGYVIAAGDDREQAAARADRAVAALEVDIVPVAEAVWGL